MRVRFKVGTDAYRAYSGAGELAAQEVRNYLKDIPPVDLRWSVFQSLICLGKLEETYLDGLFNRITEQKFVEQCGKAPDFVHWGFGREDNIYVGIKLQTDLFSDSILLLDLKTTAYRPDEIRAWSSDHDAHPYIKVKILCENAMPSIELTNDQMRNLLSPLSFKERLELMLEGKAHLVRCDHGSAPFKIHFAN